MSLLHLNVHHVVVCFNFFEVEFFFFKKWTVHYTKYSPKINNAFGYFSKSATIRLCVYITGYFTIIFFSFSYFSQQNYDSYNFYEFYGITDILAIKHIPKYLNFLCFTII